MRPSWSGYSVISQCSHTLVEINSSDFTKCNYLFSLVLTSVLTLEKSKIIKLKTSNKFAL